MRHSGVGKAIGLALCLALTSTSARAQQWKIDVGYNSLSARLGAGTPTGANISVTQVEAGAGSPAVYRPNTADTEFTGKTFLNECTSCNNTSWASHATTVAKYFYGSATSMAPGITTIGLNETVYWINAVLFVGNNWPPATETRRVQNHSWVTSDSTANATANDINRRLDLVIERDGIVSVVGVNNGVGVAVPKNLAPSYNAISVGLTSGGSSYGPVIAGMDGAGRVKPEIVAPNGAACCTSWTTPMVAGAAALLLQTADTLQLFSNLAAADQKQAKAMLCKALLLTGATKGEFAAAGGWRKGFASPSTDGTVPLDYRFGAGELNIDNSHRILTSGPKQSPGSTSIVNPTGWNLQSIAAGNTHLYFFDVPADFYATEFTTTLTWNRRIRQNSSNLTPTLPDLNLKLYEANGFILGTQRDLSVSTIDNVEHVYQQNLQPRRYALEVTVASMPADATDWEYALAWDAALAALPSMPADLDRDGDVDADDLAILDGCKTGPSLPISSGCTTADLDHDSDIDQADFGVFQRCFYGPGVLPPADCFSVN